MLSRERMERMLEAPTVEDAVKVLVECGYPDVEKVTPSSIDHMLAEVRQRIFDDLYLYAPDKRLIDVFKIKYDYHNAKVMLKSEAKGVDAKSLLIDLGQVPVDRLKDRIRTSELAGLPGSMSQGIIRARDTLGNTRNPQLSDFILDQAYFNDMQTLARDAESKFLSDYVRIMVDAVNLKSLVRTLRMGKNVEFLKSVLFVGGNIDAERVASSVGAGTFTTDAYANSTLKDAAEAGAAAASGGPLTLFEKLCDDAVIDYAKNAKFTGISEAPVIGYLIAKDAELIATRIILSGRLAGLSAQTIRERLREPYV